MNEEEYKTIRDEMLQRFRWNVELLFFAIASTGALLSWLSTKPSNELNPYLFIMVGLGIVGYIFYSYESILRQIYNQGSYLAIFHERDNEDFRWHLLNRFHKELIGEKSDWGKDGRRGAFALILLTIVNILGPLYFLRENICPNDMEKLGALIVVIVLGFLILIIIRRLFNTGEYMRENMKEWNQIKENQKADPNLLENKIKNVLSGGKNME